MGGDGYCSRHGRWLQPPDRDLRCPPTLLQAPISWGLPSWTITPAAPLVLLPFQVCLPQSSLHTNHYHYHSLVPVVLKAFGTELGILNLTLRIILDFLDSILSSQFQLSVLPLCSRYHSHPKQLCPGSTILAQSFLPHLYNICGWLCPSPPPSSSAWPTQKQS